MRNKRYQTSSHQINKLQLQRIFNCLMKSQQNAELKCKNICNRSSAKYQFTFSKQQRFKQRTVLTKSLLDKFYDLPSEISKKGSIFGKAERDCQKQHTNVGPPPGQYNPKVINSKSVITFGQSREKCTSSSIFNNTTNAYPGPGKYNPEQLKSKSYVHMAGRIKTHYETISPGPKYNFQSTLLDRNKVLSKENRKGSIRLVLPSSKSRLAALSACTLAIKFDNSMTEGIIGYKGQRRLGHSGLSTIINKQKRFSSLEMRTHVPGPGYYTSFSDFIDEPQK